MKEAGEKRTTPIDRWSYLNYTRSQRLGDARTLAKDIDPSRRIYKGGERVFPR